MKNFLLGSLILAVSSISREVSVAYVGVPLNVLFACAVGAACAFAVADKIDDRTLMWKYLFASIFMGAAFTAITNAVMIHTTPLKMTDGLQAGMGAAVAFVTRFLLPWLKDTIQSGRWIGWIPFLKKNGD